MRTGGKSYYCLTDATGAGVASAVGTGGLSSAVSWAAIGAGVGFVGSGISAMDEC